MSNYSKTTDFASKDALLTGNPLKVVKGTELDAEFVNIATAVATKEDTANKNQNNGYAGLDSSGDISDTVLSSNVPLKNAANTFSALQTCSAGFTLSSGTLTLPSAAVADAALSSNVPLKNAANTFIDAIQTISSTNPRLRLFDSNAGADAKYTEFNGNSGFAINLLDDSAANPVAAMSITRSGTSVTGIALNGAVTATSFIGNVTGNVSGTSGSTTGNAATATALQTARTINGTSFNGTANITVTAAAETLTGSALPALSGASLTALNASNISSGTISHDRLPSTVAVAPLVSSGATLDISSIEIGQEAIIYKASQTSRANNDAPSADPVLQFTSAPAGNYLLTGMIRYNGDTVGDFLVAFPRSPQASSGTIHTVGDLGLGSYLIESVPISATAFELSCLPAANGAVAASITGIQTTTAGQTISMDWSQATSDATGTAVGAGSWLKVVRIS